MEACKNDYQQKARREKKSSIEISKPWIRPAAKQANTALFFEAVNHSDKPDTLLAVKSRISDEIELHETYSKGKDLMGMRQVNAAAIPANGSVIFKPRGLHVMILNLKKDLKIGMSQEVNFIFKRANRIKIKVFVRDTP